LSAEEARNDRKCPTSEGGDAVTNNRVLVAAFGVLLVGWFMLRQTLGFYIGLPAFFIWNDLVTYLLVLIFTPAVMFEARWTAPGAVIVGVISIIMRVYGLIAASMLYGSWGVSHAYGPAVAVVLSLLFTILLIPGIPTEVADYKILRDSKQL
jgi:hypothetical protein